MLVAERAGISRASLWKVEKGDPSAAMGIYAAVLHALNNLDKDLLLVAKDDEMGRQYPGTKLNAKTAIIVSGQNWKRAYRIKFDE